MTLVNMCRKVCAFFLVLTAVVGALPATDEFAADADTSVVESTVRETRAAVPESIEDILGPGVEDAFFHTYGDDKDDDGDLQGYSKKSDDKGEDGYKHFDSFHKKDGDKYGFEKHSEYGQENKHEADATGHSGKLQEIDELTEADEDDGEESKNSYQVVEEKRKGHKQRRQTDDDGGYYNDDDRYRQREDGDGYDSGEDDRGRRRGRYNARESDEADDEESERYTGRDEDDY